MGSEPQQVGGLPPTFFPSPPPSHALTSLSVLLSVTSASPPVGDCLPRMSLSCLDVCLVSSDFPLHTKWSSVSYLPMAPRPSPEAKAGTQQTRPTQRLDSMASLTWAPSPGCPSSGDPTPVPPVIQPTQAIFVIPKTCSLPYKWCLSCRAGRVTLDPGCMEAARACRYE